MEIFFYRKLKYIVFVAVFTLFSCQKEKLREAIIDNDSLEMSAFGLIGSPPPPLDWENISFMPTPPNVPLIPVPWQGGLGGAKIDDDIIFDYKSSDGWELVYNTFSETQSFNDFYFMLYNKYSGLLRTYFYIAPGSSYPSSNISHFLNLTGKKALSSPLLAFSGSDIIGYSANSNVTSVSQLQPFMVSTTGSWYAAEFELAYDSNLSAIPFEDLRLVWKIVPNTIATININGKETGEISGTVEAVTNSPSFFGNLTSGVVNAGMKIGGSLVADSTSILNFLPDAIKSSVITAATNGLGGVVKGFFSGILHNNSSSSTSKVKLSINSSLTFSGESITRSELYDNVFGIPGTQGIKGNLPFYPNYEHSLGVFYISNTPVVNSKIYSEKNPDPTNPYYTIYQEYSVNSQSFDLIFNPAVTNVAEISNIKKEVVLMDLPRVTDLNMYGISENVAGKLIYTGAEVYFSHISPRPRSVKSKLAVRISFDVIPKDGAPKCTIVKTFFANENLL